MQKGFTLLELLVVLVLLGVASSYVGPQLWKTYTKNQERSVVQNFANALHQMRMISHREGHAIRLPAVKHGSYSIKEFPSLPAGWKIEQASPLIFLPTGVTNGGNIKIRSGSDYLWQIHINLLDGRVVIERQ